MMHTDREVTSEEPSLEAVKEYCRKRCLSIVDTALLEKYVPPEQFNPCAVCQEFDCYGCKFRMTVMPNDAELS